MIEVKGHNFMSPQLRSMPVEWLASNSELSGKVAPQVLGTTNIAVQDPLAKSCKFEELRVVVGRYLS
jgi:hypothetical protein